MSETTKELLKSEALIGKNPFERIFPKVGACNYILSECPVVSFDLFLASSFERKIKPVLLLQLYLAKGRWEG